MEASLDDIKQVRVGNLGAVAESDSKIVVELSELGSVDLSDDVKGLQVVVELGELDLTNDHVVVLVDGHDGVLGQLNRLLEILSGSSLVELGFLDLAIVVEVMDIEEDLEEPIAELGDDQVTLDLIVSDGLWSLIGSNKDSIPEVFNCDWDNHLDRSLTLPRDSHSAEVAVSSREQAEASILVRDLGVGSQTSCEGISRRASHNVVSACVELSKGADTVFIGVKTILPEVVEISKLALLVKDGLVEFLTGDRNCKTDLAGIVLSKVKTK